MKAMPMMITLLLQIFFLSSDSYGQTDTISVNRNNLRTDYLKEGTSQFLAYFKDKKTKVIYDHSIGERTIKFGRRDGKEVIIVIQHRHYNDSSTSKYVYTVSDRSSLQTLYDYTSRIASSTEAFNYSAKGVKGADTVKNNTKANFQYSFPNEFPYCSELNVETLCSLPFKRVGQKLAVSFYEPGQDYPPEFHLIAVIGSENVDAVNNTYIDCWVLRMTYDKDNYEYWWISKRRHEFLKLESHSPTGDFYKVKLFNSDENRFE
jgi:hypothetical protein